MLFSFSYFISYSVFLYCTESYIETNVKDFKYLPCVGMGERILVTSTSEVYGTAQYVPIDEEHPLQPQSPYSASKIGADAIAMSF